jgi:hypothetical protein
MQVLLHPSDQPVFRLGVRVAQCRFELRVNDVPVFQDVSGEALNFELPVNEWLFQGHNTIQVVMKPVQEGSGFGSAATVEVLLLHKCSGDAARNTMEIGALRWKPEPMAHSDHDHEHADEAEDEFVLPDDDDDGAPLLALPGKAEELSWRVQSPLALKNAAVRIHSSLNLPPPWQPCPWGRLNPLAANNGTLVAITHCVQTFWRGLRHGGFEPFLPHRRTALQASYYLREAAVEEALLFPQLLKAPGWELQPLNDKGLVLELAAGSRLARVVDEKGDSPLWLLNEADGAAAFIDCWWMFQGEWRMVR